MPSHPSLIDAVMALERQELDRPSICLSELDRRDVLITGRALFDAVAHDAPIFNRLGALLALQREDSDIVTGVMTRQIVAGILERSATWLRLDSNGVPRPVAAPSYLVDDILALPSPGLRRLRRIVRIPTHLRSGHLVQTPGYDPDSELFLHLRDGFGIPQVPDDPSVEDVEAARLLLLDDLLGDFEFESDADLANAVAIILTVVLREFFNGPSPLFVIEADRPGTGKTLLARVIAILMTGSDAGVMALPPSDDQIGKKITAALLKGQSLGVVDNIAGHVDAPSLAAVATTELWHDRRLQTSDMLTLPNTGVWILTGNQVSLSRELERRSVRILLAPRLLDGDKVFKFPELEAWTVENRGLLVWAALTLVTYWLAHGRPCSSKTLRSYVSWSRVVGGVLELLGIEGFLGNRDRHHELVDDDAMAETEFFQTWVDRIGPRYVGVTELLEKAIEVELPCLVNRTTPRQRRTALGKFLGRVAERPELAPAGFRVSRREDRSRKAFAYSVTTVRASSAAGDGPGHVVPLTVKTRNDPVMTRPVSDAVAAPTGSCGSSGSFSETTSEGS